MQNWSKRNERIAKLSIVFVSLIVGLFIAEVSLRVAGYSYPLFYETDADCGYALRPGVEGWYRKEGAAYVRINSAGLRDREHQKVKPPGTFRIAVIGDSYAEALQVPVEDAFWTVMEQRLRGCAKFAGKNVEVINFGVSGYGTAQELITLRRRVWEYTPDMVLVAVTTNNDITDNSRALKKTNEIPYFVYRKGLLVLDDSFAKTPAFRLRDSALNRFGRWMRESSRVIQAIHQSQGAIKAYIAAKRTGAAKPAAAEKPTTAATGNELPAQSETASPARAKTTTDLAEEGIDNLIYRAPDNAVWQDAWHVTEELIVLMRDEVKSHNAAFVVVTLSNGVQVYPDRELREAFMRRIEGDDLFYPDKRIEALGEREGFRVVTLAPQMQAYAEEHNVVLHGFGNTLGSGHWNASGHHLAGELIAAELCKDE